MKQFLILIAFFTILNSFSQSKFAEGYKKGFVEGYCYDKSSTCVKPIVPNTPIPKIGESLNNYKDGYNRGFTDGVKLKKDDNVRYQTSKSKYVKDKIYNPLNQVNTNNVFELAKILRESKALAIEHLENKNYQAVADISISGLKVNPQDDEFMILLGQAYLKTGNEKNAYRWLKNALRKRPADRNLRSLVKELKTNLKNR